MTFQAPAWIQRERRILLHMKCLVWCLHQMQTRYDLNLVLYSLEHATLHPEIRDSNLGDNVAFLLENLEATDLGRIRVALSRLPDSVGALDVANNHFEIGHYIQAVRDFAPIKAGTYGIIASITPRPHGVFILEGDGIHVIEAPFSQEDVRTIFGTYII